MILNSSGIDMDKGKPCFYGAYLLIAHMLVSGRKVFYKWENGGKKIE